MSLLNWPLILLCSDGIFETNNKAVIFVTNAGEAESVLLEATELDARGDAGTLYDRIAKLYGLTFKVNGYGRSLERYFASHLPPLPSAPARILDAGCGTGLLTMALRQSLARPARITAMDLSASSLFTARESIAVQQATTAHQIRFAQANLLQLPFADESFDLVVTSGALEYVSLAAGFAELARVIAPGGYLVHLPVRPSFASKVLELLFRFKTHPPAEVALHTQRHFQIMHEHRFAFPEPIGWTKLAILSRKITAV